MKVTATGVDASVHDDDDDDDVEGKNFHDKVTEIPSLI